MAIPCGCTGCPLRRPIPQWRVEDDGVVDPRGDWHLVKLQLPGTVNLGNLMARVAKIAKGWQIDAVVHAGLLLICMDRSTKVYQ